MIKIIANHTLGKRLILLALVVWGVSACAPLPMPQFQVPIPQAYPVQPGVQASRQQPVRVIPQAGALPAVPATPVRKSYPVARQQPRQMAAAKQTRQQRSRVHVPPTLKPAQQRRVQPAKPVKKQPSNATRYRYRPSASAARKPAVEYRQTPRPPALTPGRSVVSGNVRQRPVVATKPAARPVVKPGITGSLTPRTQLPPAVIRPAPRPSAAVKTNAAAAAAEKTTTATPEVAQKEVLDLSNTRQKPTATVQAEKKPAVPAAPRSYSSSPAVSILIKQANNDLSAGKTDRAAATLERALRISPDNPLLWLRLAEVNAQQGNKAQAASMARKAIGLAPDDTNLQARGQRLMN